MIPTLTDRKILRKNGIAMNVNLKRENLAQCQEILPAIRHAIVRELQEKNHVRNHGGNRRVNRVIDHATDRDLASSTLIAPGGPLPENTRRFEKSIKNQEADTKRRSNSLIEDPGKGMLVNLKKNQ